MEEKDLVWVEDLSCGCQNLVSLEEHLLHSFVISKRDIWIDILNEVRKIRTYCMEVILGNEKQDTKKMFTYAGDLMGIYYYLLEDENKEKSELWCILKHLLASSMRLQEVGTKFLEGNYVDLDKGFFDYIKKGIKKIGGKDEKEKNI